MRFGSVCSGVGAPEAAWLPLGWRCAFMSEIEPFPRAVLAHHHPEVPLHGDFTTIQAGQYAAIDLLVGGTPCQSFSVAGLRGGLADERGNLALEYLRLAERLRPRWLVWENVPGVRSSGGGRDFGAFLGGLAELGYGWAYRSLDAQHFGLAQRRERVFVVAHLGDWRPAAAVLFEPASLRGHPAPGREAGERVARTVARGSPGGRTYGLDADTADSLIANALSTKWRASPDNGVDNVVVHTLRAEGHDASEDGTGRGVPLVAATLSAGKGNGSRPAGRRQEDDVNLVAFNAREDLCCYGDQAGALGSSSPQAQAVAFDLAQVTSPVNRSRAEAGLPSPTLARGNSVSVASSMAVRRLTPRECERLQGFPEVTKTAIFRVCKNAAETHGIALSAGPSSVPPSRDQSVHAVVRVQIDLERQAVRLLNHGRCVWSAFNAAHPSSSPLSMPLDAFVRLAARMTTNLVQVTHDGLAASPQSISSSIPRLSGSVFVRVSGGEIAALASDAARFTAAVDQCMRSTTSPVGPSSQNYASTLATFGSCVAAAISSSIPEQTWAESSFDLSVETTEGYTAIPYRKGMAKDGPRYRALGNSMAVPVMRWIGRRIAAVDAAVALERAA